MPNTGPGAEQHNEKAFADELNLQQPGVPGTGVPVSILIHDVQSYRVSSANRAIPWSVFNASLIVS